MTTTITQVNSAIISTSIVAANSGRRSLVFANTDANRLYFLQGGGTASQTTYTGYLDENETVAIDGDEAKEAFSGIWALDGAGHVTVTQTTTTPLSGGASSYPLLALIREVCDLLGLARPATVINSQDQTVRQLYALAVEEGRALAKAYNWQGLKREVTFTTVAAEEQTNAVPADRDRFINNSFFNRSTRRPVIGPITDQEWQAIKANPVLNRVILAFRERDRAFLMTPTPPADQTIAYEYITSEWAISADGLTTYTKWAADTDLTYLDPTLIIYGIRWRWRKTKGLPYAEDYDSYQQEKQQAIARDGGTTILNIAGNSRSFVGNPNVPESGFGP